MNSSPETKKVIPVLWKGAAIAAGSLAIVAAKKQPDMSPALPSDAPNIVEIEPGVNETPTLTHAPGNSTQPQAIEASYVTSYNQAKSRPKRHVLKGLGGVAGTGFSRAEVKKAEGLAHTSSSFKTHPFYVTTYGPPWSGMQGTGITSTGLDLRGSSTSRGKARYEIAVDPRVIHYGLMVTVWPNALHWRGPFLAADTGGAIKGNHVDVYDWSGNALKNSFSARGAKVRPYNGIPAGG